MSVAKEENQLRIEEIIMRNLLSKDFQNKLVVTTKVYTLEK